jgi:DNA-binding LacI/PurR family transcriptional regulator
MTSARRTQTTSPPLHAGISKRLRRLVARMAPGTKLPIESTLASQYEVSIRTIREAVQQLVLEGLVDRQQGRGTFVLNRRERAPVAIVIQANLTAPDTPYYWFRLVQELRVACSNRQMLSAVYSGQTPWFHGPVVENLDCPRFAEDLADGRLRGVISVATKPLQPWWQAVQELQLPLVGDDDRLPVSVGVDEQSLVRLAITAFVAAGRKRPALIRLSYTGANEDTETTRRFLVAAADAGLPIPPHRRLSLYDAADWRAAATAIAGWLGEPEPPDAIFVESDLVYPAVAMALARVGAPENLTLVTHHNAGGPWSSLLPATRIGFDPAQIANRMVELLCAQEQGPPAPPGVHLVPAIVMPC